MDGDLRIVAPDRFPAAGAGTLEQAIGSALTTRGRCSLALAGGSTPRPVYRRLAEASRLDWGGVHVYFSDERAVRPDDPESNYRMAREALLDRVPVPAGQRHRIEAERDDLRRVAVEYARDLPNPLDVAVLGIGADGHVASLFPGSPALDEAERLTAVVADAPKPPARRITLTPPALRSARSLVVLAAGRRKAAAVQRALEGDVGVGACPARIARGGTWVLDREAASRLSAPSPPG